MKRLIFAAILTVFFVSQAMAAVTIKLRGDTAANWTSNDPVLALREPGVETDTQKMKIGDGTTAWTSLSYTTGGTYTESSPLQYVYYDVSSTDTGYKFRVPTGAAWNWTNAYSWCDGAESALVYTVYRSTTLGGTFTSLGTIAHNSAAATDTIDISAFTDPSPGDWLRVDITTPGTTATECTLVLEN